MKSQEMSDLMHQILKEIKEQNAEDLLFFKNEEDGEFPVIRMRHEQGNLILECDDSVDPAVEAIRVFSELYSLNNDAEVFVRFTHCGNRLYDITDDWDFNEDMFAVVTLDEDEVEVESIDLTDGGRRDTATVDALKPVLAGFNRRRHLFLTVADIGLRASVDNIYPREGKCTLQSNQIEIEKEVDDPHAHSLRLDYIIHCLSWFSGRTSVEFMHCDNDNDFTFYDIKGYHTEDGDIVLDGEEQ